MVEFRAPESGRASVRRLLVIASIFLKLVTVGGMIFGVTHSDWGRFAHKAFPDRLFGYTVAILVVPLIWWVRNRRRATEYPALVDVLTTLPFAIDIVGNLVDGFDRFDHFDEACHFVNWALLGTALAVSLRRSLPWLVQVGLVVGLGSLAALAWEDIEYFTFVGTGPERITAYSDTLSDMTLGTSGALLAAVSVAACRRAAGKRSQGKSIGRIFGSPSTDEQPAGLDTPMTP
jgi:hypothetical protein